MFNFLFNNKGEEEMAKPKLQKLQRSETCSIQV